MRSTIILLSLVVAAPAAAEDEPPAAPTATAPDPTGERVTMPAKRGMIRAVVDINLSTDVAGDPISISPDIWYGINDKMTIGLVHSFVGETGIVGIPVASSLCIGDACGKVYNGFGLDMRYGLKADKKVAVAFEAGLIALDLDPTRFVLKLGAAGRYRLAPKVALDFQPNVFIGLTKRQPDGMGNDAGNKEVLTVPLSGVFAVSPKASLMTQLALLLPFSAAADAYLVAFSLGGMYSVNKQIGIEAAFTLPAVIGGEFQQTGVDGRTFSLGGVYAF